MRKIFNLVLLAVSLAVLSSCISLDDINITSAKISSITPTGLKSVKGTATVGVNNETSEFTLSEISGTVYKDGTTIGTFTADDVTVLGKTNADYTVSGRFALSNSISILEVISIATNLKLDDLSADLTFKIKPKGSVGKTVELEQVPVKQLISAVKK